MTVGLEQEAVLLDSVSLDLMRTYARGKRRGKL